MSDSPQRRWLLKRACQCLRAGGVIAYPTESVYGLGCDPDNPAALQRLLALKQRPAGKGLILIAASYNQLLAYIEPLENAAMQKILQTWPGPVTWVLPARPEVSPLVRGQHSTLAVRVTGHPLAAALCVAFGRPIVSTSANLAGRPPARSALQVRQRFNGLLDFILPGAAGPLRRPSVIRDGRSGRTLRPA